MVLLQTETRREPLQLEANVVTSPAIGSMNCVRKKHGGRFPLAQLLVSGRVKEMDTLSSVLRQAWLLASGICPGDFIARTEPLGSPI